MAADDRMNQERMLRAAVLRGDEQAWRHWYELSAADLRAYVVWRCGGSRDVADEVVQEVWLIAVRRIREFEPGKGPFAAWLRGIAANVLKNQRRKKGLVPRGDQPHGIDRVDATPLEGLRRRDEADRIVETLNALPERYEAILRAKYLDQRSMAEIARDWNESIKAIESLLTRARAAFRECFQLAGGDLPGPIPAAVTPEDELK